MLKSTKSVTEKLKRGINLPGGTWLTIYHYDFGLFKGTYLPFSKLCLIVWETGITVNTNLAEDQEVFEVVILCLP